MNIRYSIPQELNLGVCRIHANNKSASLYTQLI